MDEAGESGAVGKTLARSRAFREASLQSEVQRAWVVIASVALVGVMAVLPNVTGDVEINIKIAACVGIAGLVALQMCVLFFAAWARRRDREIPLGVTVATVVIESLIPAAIIWWNIEHGSLAPYTSLSSPPILVYGLLLVLTTLRLRPGLCVLAGVLCALSYGGLLAYVTYGLGLSRPTTGLPYAAYINSSVVIFITGLAAAWVAREIRRHTEAALGEAETKHRVARMEQDLAVAQTIQRALLPRGAPAVAGYDIAGWNRSADQTGGDYYDWQALPDGNWMVTLADVSGHGIGPALVTAACRAYVRASSFYNADLASLTSRMNRLLADDLPDGRFVTMVTVVIDPKGGPVRLLSAGHGPIVLYARATGGVRDIMPRDLPLAVDAESSFGPAEAVDLAPGDVLALVTDGFVEWSRPGNGVGAKREQFGMERLRESMGRHAHLPAEAMIAAIAADVGAFAGSEAQQDDLTMVVVKRSS